jgi:hypothetical protein
MRYFEVRASNLHRHSGTAHNPRLFTGNNSVYYVWIDIAEKTLLRRIPQLFKPNHLILKAQKHPTSTQDNRNGHDSTVRRKLHLKHYHLY